MSKPSKRDKRYFVLIFTLFLVVAFPVKASNSIAEEEWSYYQTIELQGDHDYKAFFLAEESYQYLNEDLTDIRIVDGEKQQVPYLLQRGYTVSDETETVYTAEVIKQWKIQDEGHTIMDIHITPHQEFEDVKGNQLKIELPNQSFHKYIELFGGYDGDAWEPIGTFELYQVGEVSKNTLDFEDSFKYPYYRLKVVNNDENLAFGDIELINSAHRLESKEFKKGKEALFKQTEDQKQSVIEVQNPLNLNIQSIQLESDGVFQRRYEVYDENMNWIETIGAKELYQLDFKDANISQTNIQLETPSRSSKLLIRIDNQDNAPLILKRVSLTYFVDRVIFKAGNEGPYRLYFGNANAPAPSYDIESFASYILQEDMDQLTLGTVTALNPIEEQTDSTNNLKLIFNIVMVLISLTLIILLTRALNKKSKQNPNTN